MILPEMMEQVLKTHMKERSDMSSVLFVVRTGCVNMSACIFAFLLNEFYIHVFLFCPSGKLRMKMLKKLLEFNSYLWYDIVVWIWGRLPHVLSTF